MKKIVYPTDFSAKAEGALEAVALLAGQTKAEVQVLHAFHVPMIDPHMPVNLSENMDEEQQRLAEGKLKEICSRIKDEYNLKCTYKSRMGFAVDEIIYHLRKEKPDLTIMGMRGEGNAGIFSMGSVTSSIIEKAVTPVLAVPQKTTLKQLKNICYASDLTKGERKSMRELLTFAEPFGASITVLHVKQLGKELSVRQTSVMEQIADEAKDHDIRFKVLESSNIVETIGKFVEKGAYDVLSVASCRRNFINKLFHKSISRQMCYHTQIPVLAIHK